jgi:hypothetical protein
VRLAAGATAEEKGGILKALRRAPPGAVPRPSRAAKRRYVTAADVLADLAPPEIARKLRVKDEAKKAPIAPTFSSHLFSDALSLSLHAVIARKILHDPSILERARSTLERWLSNQRPAPKPFVEWRRILTGTPQEIAAVALSMTEEAIRLRSSSPLGCLLKNEERAAVYAAFGKLGSLTDLREELRAVARGERSASSIPTTTASARLAAVIERRRRAQQAQRAEVLSIASKMKTQGLPDDLIARAVDLSQEFEGILKLMRMWRDEPELSEREPTVATIQEVINDCAKVEASKQLIGAGAHAETLGAFLDDWERAHGRFTDDELRAAAALVDDPKPRASSSAGKAGKPKKFARILAQAIKTFGSQDAAEAWLNSPAMSLEMKRPIDLMSTTEGAQLVEDILGRIDAGVFT